MSHSVAEITRLADTVVLLSEGRMLAVGDVDEVMGRLDLRARTGRYEAGAVIDATVGVHDTASGLTTLAFDGGELIVPSVEALAGERVRVRIRARDVSLALSRPSGLSIVNVLESTLVAIADDGGPIVEVAVASRRDPAAGADHEVVAHRARASRGPAGLCADQGGVARPPQRRLRVGLRAHELEQLPHFRGAGPRRELLDPSIAAYGLGASRGEPRAAAALAAGLGFDHGSS